MFDKQMHVIQYAATFLDAFKCNCRGSGQQCLAESVPYHQFAMLQCSESGTDSFVLNCRPRAIADKGTTRDVHNGTSSSITEYTSFKVKPISGKMYEGWNFNSGNYLFTTDTK